jgi:L-ascorbate metabolism protein UlaG (beta-lactamase superfamily)
LLGFLEVIMDIIWYGQACFKLKGKNATVIIDPFDPEAIGLKLPNKDMEADVVLKTHDHPDHNNVMAVGGNPKIFDGPGEYESKGVVITAVSTFHDNTEGSERGKNVVFHVLIDGIRIVHLGDLGQHSLTEEQISEIDQTDILLIPVGSVFTINAKQAVNIVSQLEPKITIPMHYLQPGLKVELEPVENFLKEMGVEGLEPQSKLSITKDKLPDEPEVVVLSKT